MHIGCGFKSPKRKHKVDRGPKALGGSGERSHSLGMWLEPALLGGEGAPGPGPVPHSGRVVLAGSCLQPSQLLPQKQMTALMKNRENKNEYRGKGSWKGDWYFFLGVWFLYSGWVTVEVWNAVRQWVGMGQRQGARTLAKGPKAPGPPAAQSEQGPGMACRAGLHPTLVCWSQRFRVAPGKGDRLERTRKTRGEGRGLEVGESMVRSHL